MKFLIGVTIWFVCCGFIGAAIGKSLFILTGGY